MLPITAPEGVPNPEQRPALTIEEAGEILGLSRSSAYRAAKAGDIPTLRFGGRRIVPTAALRRMLGLDPAPETTGAP